MPDAGDLITPSQTMLITGRVSWIYDLLISSVGTSTNMNETQSISAMAYSLHQLIVGNEDNAIFGLSNRYRIEAMAPASYSSMRGLSAENLAVTSFGMFVQRLSSHIAQMGRYVNTSINSLDSYASYWTGQGTDTSYAWQFARIYYLYSGSAQMLAASNVTGPSIILSIGTVTGVNNITFTDGSAVATANDVANGIQGYRADNLAMVLVSGTFSGTLSATGTNQNGTAGRVWKYSGVLTSPGTVSMTPVISGDRCLDVSTHSYTGPGSACVIRVVTRGPDIQP